MRSIPLGAVGSVFALVTVVSVAASEPRDLQALLARVCAAHDIVLRYDAAPGTATTTYVADRSVERRLERLLKGYSYVITRRRDASTGAERITRVHVLARQRRRSAPPPNPSAFAVHRSVLDAAFAADGTSDAAAIDALIAGVRASPERLQAFLATDPATMARDLRRYPRAEHVLRTIARRTDLEAGVAAKLRALLTALE